MANDFGELVLVLGDLHIPHRAIEIPEKFKKILIPGKIQHIICTGNLVNKEQYEELRKLAPNIHIVMGDFDEFSIFNDEKIITIGQFKIGICHGHQIIPTNDIDMLQIKQRKMDVDVLITGNTHKCDLSIINGKWFVNPGSITGAYSIFQEETIPSFILMAIQGNKIVAYVYELKDTENDKNNKNIIVCKTEYIKE